MYRGRANGPNVRTGHGGDAAASGLAGTAEGDNVEEVEDVQEATGSGLGGAGDGLTAAVGARASTDLAGSGAGTGDGAAGGAGAAGGGGGRQTIAESQAARNPAAPARP